MTYWKFDVSIGAYTIPFVVPASEYSFSSRCRVSTCPSVCWGRTFRCEYGGFMFVIC